MDMPHLKLLAGRVRDLLQDSNSPIGHSQALDLIAAIPGVRNWPEVQAFPAFTIGESPGEMLIEKTFAISYPDVSEWISNDGRPILQCPNFRVLKQLIVPAISAHPKPESGRSGQQN